MKGWEMFVAETGTELNALGWDNVSRCFEQFAYPYTAKNELIDRLNIRLGGEDPGIPVNWRGIR